jgi:hypothetical protein
VPWTSAEEKPKRADLKAWADHVCNVSMAGESHKDRRRLFKTLLEGAWCFANWLTHAKGSKWHDAEAAFSTTEQAVSLCTSAVVRYMRGVPDACPACGSHRLSLQRGFRQGSPDTEWERPTCDKCGSAGEPVPIVKVPQPPKGNDRPPPEGECVTPIVPLRTLMKPRSFVE